MITILSNFVFMLWFCSSNASALGSSIEVIENLKGYDRDELVIVSAISYDYYWFAYVSVKGFEA
ncbi:MAG: hypothetical protein ACRD8Z_10715 [Nitrososphaeraceae archaeon]